MSLLDTLTSEQINQLEGSKYTKGVDAVFRAKIHFGAREEYIINSVFNNQER